MAIPKTIFLTGKVSGSQALNEMSIVQGMLEAAGFNVTTAAEGLPEEDLSRVDEESNTEPMKAYLKKRAENRAAADSVLYLDFQDDSHAHEDIFEARHSGKHVMHAKQFLDEYAKEGVKA